MTLSEYYEKIGGNYNDVIERLAKEDRIIKYLKQFAADKTLEEMNQQLEAEQYEQAFATVHNIKGLGLNLGLTPLIVTAGNVCDVLRNGRPSGDISELVDDLKRAYELITENIALLDD